MARSWDRPWSIEEIVESAPKWTLAGDVALLKTLEDFSEKLFVKAETTHDNVNELLDGLNESSIKLDLVKNEFLGLQNTQFIESRVYEDDETLEVTSDEKTVKKESEAETKEAMKHAVLEGLQILDKYYEKVSVPASDSEDDEVESNCVLRMKDPYINRPLPYLIGTREWYDKWHVGLLASSSEDEEEEVEEKYSDTDSESNLPVTDRRGISTSDSGTDLSNRVDKPVASSTFNDTLASTDSEECNNSVPSKPPISHLSFAEQLAARLSNVDVNKEPEQPVHVNKKPIQKSTAPSRIIGDLLSDEPPPLEDSEDGLFGGKSSQGMFSGGDGLFDDSDNDTDYFGGRKVLPTKIEPIKSSENKVPNLFDDNEEEGMFAQKVVSGNKNDKSKATSHGLFSDEESDDNDLFSSTSNQQYHTQPNYMKSTASAIPFFPDEPPELVSKTKGASRNLESAQSNTSDFTEKSSTSGDLEADNKLLINAKLKSRKENLFDEVDQSRNKTQNTKSGNNNEEKKNEFSNKDQLFDDSDDDSFDNAKKSGGLFDDLKQPKQDVFADKPKKKVGLFDDPGDLFNDDLFSDVIFPTSHVRKEVKEKKKLKLFDDDDDDMFFDSSKRNSTANENVSKNKNEVIEKSKGNEGIFKEEKKNEIIFEKDKRNESMFKEEKRNENIFKTEKKNESIFKEGDRNESIFEDEKRNESIFEDEKRNESIFEDEKRNESIFEDEKRNESIFEEGKRNESIFEDQKIERIFDEDKMTESIIEEEKKNKVIFKGIEEKSQKNNGNPVGKYEDTFAKNNIKDKAGSKLYDSDEDLFQPDNLFNSTAKKNTPKLFDSPNEDIFGEKKGSSFFDSINSKSNLFDESPVKSNLFDSPVKSGLFSDSSKKTSPKPREIDEEGSSNNFKKMSPKLSEIDVQQNNNSDLPGSSKTLEGNQNLSSKNVEDDDDDGWDKPPPLEITRKVSAKDLFDEESSDDDLFDSKPPLKKLLEKKNDLSEMNESKHMIRTAEGAESSKIIPELENGTISAISVSKEISGDEVNDPTINTRKRLEKLENIVGTEGLKGIKKTIETISKPAVSVKKPALSVPKKETAPTPAFSLINDSPPDIDWDQKSETNISDDEDMFDDIPVASQKASIFDREPPALDFDKSKSSDDNSKNSLFDDKSKSSLFNEDDIPSANRVMSLFDDEPPSLDFLVKSPQRSGVFSGENASKTQADEIFDDKPKNVTLEQGSEKADLFSNDQVDFRGSDQRKNEGNLLFGGFNEDDGPIKSKPSNKMDPKRMDFLKKSELGKPSDETPKKKDSPGKLKHNLNINVNALMPGVSLPWKKDPSPILSKSKSLEESPEKEGENSESIPHAQSCKDVRATQIIDKDGDVETLHSITKNRARIQTKRKPSTRRGRQAAIKKRNEEDNNNLSTDSNKNSSPETYPDDNSTISSQNNNPDIHESTSKINTKKTETESESQNSNSNENNNNDLYNVGKATNRSFQESEKSVLKQNNSKVKEQKEREKPVMSQKNTNSNLFDDFSDESDSDIFSSKQQKSKSNLFEDGKQKNVVKDTNKSDLFDDKQVEQKPISVQAKENNLFEDVKQPTLPKEKSKVSLFDDDEDDLFASKDPKKKVKSSEGSLFNDDPDIFSPKTAKVHSGANKRSSLFDDLSEDEDIFGSGSSQKNTSKPMNTSSDKRHARNKNLVKKSEERTAVSDPLDALSNNYNA